MSGITAAVPTAQLKLPAGYNIPVTLTSATGGFVIAPQQSDGSEVLIGKQRRLEDRDRAGWDNFMADKVGLADFLRGNNGASHFENKSTAYALKASEAK